MKVRAIEIQQPINNLKSITLVFEGFKHLWGEQAKHIREGGLVILFQKTYTLIIMPFAATAVIMLRILRPWITIRLGYLNLGRIGTLYSVLWYLSEHSGGQDNRRFLDIFYLLPYSPINNTQWLKILRRHLYICSFPKLAHTVNKLNNFLPGSAVHVIDYPHPPSRDTFQYVLAHNKPLFHFTPPEEILGQKMLQDLGIPRQASFVCFHSRDAAFLETYYAGKDWTYHDYRDTSIRNYRAAVEKLIDKGYFAIRMGAAVKEKFASHHPAIIDYATNGHRTDFLDLYLGAKCRFFLGSDSGITIIPEAFKRPIVYTNWVSIQLLPAEYYHQGLIIMKKWYSVKEQRFLTFREILKVAKPHHIRPKELGVELIDNTPEEILDVVVEMEERLEGTWVTKKEDEELQERFWVLYGKDKLRGPDVRIGAQFLRQNQHLLN